MSAPGDFLRDRAALAADENVRDRYLSLADFHDAHQQDAQRMYAVFDKSALTQPDADAVAASGRSISISDWTIYDADPAGATITPGADSVALAGEIGNGFSLTVDESALFYAELKVEAPGAWIGFRCEDTTGAFHSINYSGVALADYDTLVLDEDLSTPTTIVCDVAARMLADKGAELARISQLRIRGAATVYSLTMRDRGTATPGESDVPRPTWPTGALTVGTVTDTSIALSWSGAVDDVGVVGYRVFVDGTQRADVTGTSYTVTGLAVGALYSLRVEAYDADGNQSLDGPEASQRTTGGAATGSIITPSTIELDWSALDASLFGPQDYASTADLPAATDTSPLITSRAQLESEYANASPGKHLVIKDGSYADWGRTTFGASGTNGARGTRDAPIVIRSESHHGATLSGAGWTFYDRHILLSGLRVPNGNGNILDVYRDDIRASHCYLQGTGRALWIATGNGITANDTLLRHCTMEGFDGQVVAIQNKAANANFSSVPTPRRCWVDYCKFINHDRGNSSFPALQPGVGYEPFAPAPHDRNYFMVSNTLFDNVHDDNDELVSVKWGSFYLVNCMAINCEGSAVTYRMTKQSHMSGFINPNGNKGGMRIYGDDPYVSYSVFNTPRAFEFSGHNIWPTGSGGSFPDPPKRYNYRATVDGRFRACIFDNPGRMIGIINNNVGSGLPAARGNRFESVIALGGSQSYEASTPESEYNANNPLAKRSDVIQPSGSGPVYTFANGTEIDLTDIVVPNVWDPLHRGNPSTSIVHSIAKLPWWDSVVNFV